MKNDLNRREFLSRALAAAPVVALAASTAQAKAPLPGPQICLFSKPLQYMDYKTLAQACKEAGLDGVDLTVRPGGHVEPDKVDTDLPKAAEAIQAEGLAVSMITTKYTDINGPNVAGVFARAAALGIPFVRVGNHTYDRRGAIPPQVQKFTEELRGLAAAAEKAGVTLGYHNHSGGNCFGAPLWDLYQALETVNSDRLGSNFDIGHARVEGAFSGWDINARLMAPRVKMVAVKDFIWDGSKNEPKWVTLGTGIVDVAGTLSLLREVGQFCGPLSIHIEYKIDKNTIVDEMKKSVVVVREALKKAGYAG